MVRPPIEKIYLLHAVLTAAVWWNMIYIVHEGHAP